MLGSTGKWERGRAGVEMGVCVCLESGSFLLQLYPSLNCAAGGRDRGVAFSVNIRILRAQFTRCVSLTFTVTVITSWGFPTLLHCTGCTFNYSKHWFPRMMDYLWLFQADKAYHLVTRIHPFCYRLFILTDYIFNHSMHRGQLTRTLYMSKPSDDAIIWDQIHIHGYTWSMYNHLCVCVCY